MAKWLILEVRKWRVGRLGDSTNFKGLHSVQSVIFTPPCMAHLFFPFFFFSIFCLLMKSYFLLSIWSKSPPLGVFHAHFPFGVYITHPSLLEQCISYFCQCCDQIPDKKQLKGGRLILVHSLRGYCPPWQGRHWGQELKATGSLRLLYQEAKMSQGLSLWRDQVFKHREPMKESACSNQKNIYSYVICFGFLLFIYFLKLSFSV